MSTAPHDTQLLGAYVLGTLDAQERNEINRHVESCATCRAELMELEAVKDVLDELPPEALLHGPPDADLVLQRTLRQVRAESLRIRIFSSIHAAAVKATAVTFMGRNCRKRRRPTSLSI